MVVEKLPEVNPPSGRVLGRGFLTLLISGALWRWNDGEIRDSGYDGRVSDWRGKYRPKEGTGGGGAHPGGDGEQTAPGRRGLRVVSPCALARGVCAAPVPHSRELRSQEQDDLLKTARTEVDASRGIVGIRH